MRRSGLRPNDVAEAFVTASSARGGSAGTGTCTWIRDVIALEHSRVGVLVPLGLV